MSNGDVMKRILTLFLSTILLFAVGCDVVAQKEYSEPVVVLPNDIMAETVNGYKNIETEQNNSISSNTTSSSLQNDTDTIYANKNTKKYHKSDCRYAKNLTEDKRIIFQSESDAFESGYSACKVCFKE